jgi:2-isopropylmalate synthase
MSITEMSPYGLPSLLTPSGSKRSGQPHWNQQKNSSMPFGRYARQNQASEIINYRDWPSRHIEFAPLWCSVDLRDGNQALPSPMDSKRKNAMFDLLVQMGFKEIEVGYPAASETDFHFVQELINGGSIPDDVTISVFTPAKKELIDRTFNAVRGAQNVVIHLCMATACLWREVVFDMSSSELMSFTSDAARHVVRRADELTAKRVRFEYTPETFNVTEPDFALSISNEVTSIFGACPERPVTLNLPSTVETNSPNEYADQIEWMHRNLGNRDGLILSVHPHNDRGTAVAAAELALMAGADRVEGTLFGNGERTGNVCLATLALNLFSAGVDPQLDFSDIDGIRRIVEYCNEMPVNPRHPYAGDLVYTAFSGTHQDAIAKGLAALEGRARLAGQATSSLSWEVPYLPIDPRDVGRTYKSVVRLNSQSGKGGVAHVILADYGFDIPRGMRVEFSRIVQTVAEETGGELNSHELWELFERQYLRVDIREVGEQWADNLVHLTPQADAAGGSEVPLDAAAESMMTAVNSALTRAGSSLRVRSVDSHPVVYSGRPMNVGYAELVQDGRSIWGAAVDASATAAILSAAVSVIARLAADEDGETPLPKLARLVALSSRCTQASPKTPTRRQEPGRHVHGHRVAHRVRRWRRSRTAAKSNGGGSGAGRGLARVHGGRGPQQFQRGELPSGRQVGRTRQSSQSLPAHQQPALPRIHTGKTSNN